MKRYAGRYAPTVLRAWIAKTTEETDALPWYRLVIVQEEDITLFWTMII